MREALDALAAFYGPLAPPPRDLFGFVVWEILSARTLPSRRDIAWLMLRRLPALTPDAMFRASKADLQEALTMLTARDERIDALRTASAHLRRHRGLDAAIGGPLPRAVRVLARVPGLDPEGRVRALLFPGGHAVPPVDAGTVRVVARLYGLTSDRPAGLRRQSRARMRAAEGGGLDMFRVAAVVLAHHASHACAEIAPHCGVCPLAGGCRYVPATPPGAGPALS